MEKTKFMTLFDSLSARELRGFERYLKGYYHKEEVAVNVFDCVKAAYRSVKKRRKLSIESVYEAAFGETCKTHNDRVKVLNTFSDLYLWLKEYLLTQELQNNYFERELMWFNLLRRRELFHRAENTITKLKQKELKNPEKDIWHYSRMVQLYYCSYFRSEFGKLQPEIEELKDLKEFTELFSLIAKLQLTCETENRVNIIQQESSLSDIRESLHQAQHYPEHALIQFYFLTLKLLLEKREEDYYELKDQLKKAKGISMMEIQSILGYLLNFTAISIGQKKRKFLEEALDLYDWGIEYNVFFYEQMSAAKFNNMVAIGVTLKKFDWLNKVLPKCIGNLPQQVRHNTQVLANAQIAFGQQNYSKAIKLLQDVKFSDVFYQLRANSILIRCYYDQDKNDIVIYPRCYAFRQFLNRNKKLGELNIKRYKNFIRMIEILLKPNTGISNAKREFEKLNPVACSEWLQEKFKKG